MFRIIVAVYSTCTQFTENLQTGAGERNASKNLKMRNQSSLQLLFAQ